MILAKAGKEFELTLNSKQKHFGVTGFKVEVINLADGTTTAQDVDVTEVIKNIDDPKSATTTQDALKGTRTVKVKDNTLEDGMVFDDGNGNKYYIESIDNDGATITTRTELVADIPADTTLQQVGNTGIYKIPVTIDTVGLYNVVVSNPAVNLRNLSAFVKVTQYDIDDIGNQIESKTQEILDKIDDAKAQLSGNNDSDYEIVS